MGNVLDYTHNAVPDQLTMHDNNQQPHVYATLGLTPVYATNLLN